MHRWMLLLRIVLSISEWDLGIRLANVHALVPRHCCLQYVILCKFHTARQIHKGLGTRVHAKTLLEQSFILPSLPLSLRNTIYCCVPAIQTSWVVGLTEGITVAGLKMVSTPFVTVPSDDEIGTEFRVHIELEFTAPSNRHLKHVCTPPSAVNIVGPEILKVSTQSVCELTVEKKCDYDSHCDYFKACIHAPSL